MTVAPPRLPIGSTPEWLADASKGWKSRVTVRAAAGALRAKERYDFQRACLPYLQIILGSSTVEVPEMGGWDAAGIDHVSWPDSGPRLRAVIQCKGFVVSEHEVGSDQAKQCVQSIEKFGKSGLQTDGYVILHNRDGRNADFRGPVAEALARLHTSGAASWVAMWDRNSLLEAVCDSLKARLERSFRLHGLEAVRRTESLLSRDIVDAVPLRSGSHRITASDIHGSLGETAELRDPADALAATTTEGEGLRLVFGGFGVGKTTAALRLARRMGRGALYIPAALLRADISGGRHVLWEVIDKDLLRDAVPDADMSAVEPLASSVVDRMLSTPRDDLVLIVDGLDEAPIAHRRNGLSQVINATSPVRFPVVLTMRTEFWQSRTNELAGTINSQRAAGAAISAIELSLWSTESIVELAQITQRRYQEEANTVAVAHLAEFIRLVGSPEFEEWYGDIPRRPLFLQMLLSDIADRGIHKKSRVELMHDWIAAKIARDWQNPEHIAPGGGHRPALAGEEETLDTSIALAWQVMDTAAGLTLTAPSSEAEVGGKWDLAPDLRWSGLTGALPWLSRRPDLAAVCTQTVLVPAGSHQSGRPQRITFAHRAFQEFLAARYELEKSSVPFGQLPSSVRDWTERMTDEHYP